MFNFIKKSFPSGVFAAIIIAVFFAGVFLGYQNRPEVDKITSLLNKEDLMVLNNEQQFDFSSFWKTWSAVQEKYVSNDELDKQEMIWGSIAGLVASLDDPYSVFFPPKESEIFESTVRGDFEGVGMEIGARDGILTVVSPLKGTPAHRAGMKAGDKVLKIEEIFTSDLTIDEAVQLIRGERGTKVTLTVLREEIEEPFQVEITRDRINIPVIETSIKDGGIFVIELYSFSGKSTDSFRGALREFVGSDTNKLILDLRGNAGGYLESAIDIASWFLPIGEVVAREQFGDGEEQLYRSKGYDIFKDLPMVILVNEGSASASEIVAGALREHGKATLIGKKTYGKGSVQELIPIANGSSIKLTIARWLTPEGVSISKNGLEPDIEVEYSIEEFEAGLDPQMDKAIEVLTNN
ncbi:S41 family peptidase [Patescibacteria group bacterium]